MILGLDENYYVLYVGEEEPEQNFYSVKIVDEELDMDLENYVYRYSQGKIEKVGYTEKGKPRTEEEKIKEELEELDQTINRATEDLYELTGTTPYRSTGEVIERKKELRQQLKNINEEKTEEKNDTSEQEADVSEETSE